MNITVSYALVQFFFWFAYGAAVNFCSVYLLACGLSNTVIGFVSAAACLLSVLLQPALAAFADRNKNVPVRRIILLLTCLLALLGLAMIPAYGAQPALNAALLGSAILTVQMILPFTNAMATEAINAGAPLNFSAARGLGSVGYAVMSFSVGRLIAAHSAKAEPYVIVASALCLIAACLPFPSSGAGKTHAAAKTASGSRPLAFLKAYPGFAMTLAGCALIYTGHVLINSFVYQITVSKGGTSEHMGVAMALAGLLEVLTMFFFPVLLRFRGCSFWFRISGLFFALKSLATLLAGSIGALYAVQLLQPFGWGLMTVSSVYHVNALMRDQDKIKGQAFMTMTLSVGTILGSLSGGWLIDRIGVDGMLTAAAVIGAAGWLTVLRAARKN